MVPAAEFFTLPRVDFERENVLAPDELLVAVHLPSAGSGARSTYHKVLDREAWTHAVVSAAVVLEMDQQVCRRASIVLGGVAPIPWRLPKVEAMLVGRRITPALAAQAGDAAVEGARPLAKNGYKGYYCFEWEKRWHPDIEEPEVAFPHYATTMRQYLAEMGVKV